MSTSADETRVHAATVRGLLRGAEVDGAAELALGAALELRASGRHLVLALTELDGVRVETDAMGATTLTLFVAGGDVLELTGDTPLAALGERLLARATELPELTRALRGIGASRGGPGADHDRFFRPLLAARADAERATHWRARTAAFAAPPLDMALLTVLRDLAAERWPESAPDRRALEAELTDLTDELRAALVAVDAAAAATHAASDATYLAAWRGWVTAVGALFAAADRCWLAARPVLNSSPDEE